MLFFFQAEDGIRDQPRSRGLGDVYKRQDYWGISPYPYLSEDGLQTKLSINVEKAFHA